MTLKQLIPPPWIIVLSLTLGLLVAAFFDLPPVSTVDHHIYNLFSLASKRNFNAPIVVVEITERDLLEQGPWPWPRSKIAAMVKKISRGGALAIGLTIPLSRREWNPGIKEIKRLRRKIQSGRGFLNNRSMGRVDDLLEKSLHRIDNDNKLRLVLKKVRNLTLPIMAEFPAADSRRPHKNKLPAWLKHQSISYNGIPSDIALLRGFRNPLPRMIRDKKTPMTLLTVYPELAKTAGRHGLIFFPPDNDGTVRRLPLLLLCNGRLLASMPLQLALTSQRGRLSDLKVANGRKGNFGLRFKEIRIPTDPAFNMLINISRAPTALQVFSAGDVLNGRVPLGFLKGKTVIIGEGYHNAPHHRLADGTSVSTPYLTGLATENIINETYRNRPGWGWILETVIILYLGMFILMVSPKVNFKTGAISLGSFIMIWWGLAFFLFNNNGIYFKTGAPTILLFCVFTATGLRRFLSIPRKKAQGNTEINKMLGLSFQGQGLLDMAFDTFMKCDPDNPSVKEALYNLGLDFERKRMPTKAISVYQYIEKHGHFKDADGRIRRLKRAENKAMPGDSGGSPKTDLLLGTNSTRPTLGRYEVIKEIGKGAIGTVYLGRDPKINRKVAIKTLRYDDVSPDQIKEVKERFFREAEAAGRLSHPNIVTIYDCGEDYDITYMAMEYLNGHDLARYCRPNSLIPAKMVVNILIRVAFALDYAHKHEVVHRDVKPANIMLTEKGQVKVTDFGIARLTKASQTQTGVILGTPNYMSPEQVLGKKVDGRSDIFSLGAVFYEMLTGCKPFKSDNIGSLMHAISEANFRPVNELRPGAPPCCVAIIDKMMARNPAQRYRTAGEMVIEAQQCLEDL